MRHELLTLARIPFVTITQSADELSCNWKQDPLKVAEEIALCKMNAAEIPMDTTDSECFVLTADTICVDHEGNIHGKPKDSADAHRMLRLWRHGCLVITSFCLDKKQKEKGLWIQLSRIEKTVSATIEFSVPDELLEAYLAYTPSLECAGAMAIEGYGLQFVKTIHGSNTTIIGLPLFEVTQSLLALGFFSFNTRDR